MIKIKLLLIGLILGALLVIPTASHAGKIIGIDLGTLSAPIPEGVICSINDVNLIAQNADDCANAGGVVTHDFEIVVEPVDQ